VQRWDPISRSIARVKKTILYTRLGGLRGTCEMNSSRHRNANYETSRLTIAIYGDYEAFVIRIAKWSPTMSEVGIVGRVAAQ
jgi:hypothetical protein